MEDGTQPITPRKERPFLPRLKDGGILGGIGEREIMNRLKMCMRVCVLAIVLTTLLLATSVAKAAPLTCGTWKVVPSPNPISGSNLLSGVATVSTNNAWAVGYSSNSKIIPQTLIEHWNGTSWKVIPSPNVDSFSTFLSGAAAISAHDVWAVGYYLNSIGTALTLIEHWNGSSWQIVPSPNTRNGGALSGVSVISASDIWAVGSSSAQTLTEHWNGTSWKIVPSPNVGSNNNLLNGVATVSTNNVWAVGDYLNSSAIAQTLIEHWNGTSWKVVSSPNAGSHDNFLNAVARIPSSSNVVAVGYYTSNNGNNRTLTEFYC